MATRIKDIQTNVEDLVTAREARAPSRQPLAVPVESPVTFPLELPENEARLRTPAVGQRATRPDGRLHGLGQTQYIDDMTFPHMLHAKILRSEYAHARIVSVDTSEAEKMPGVIANTYRRRSAGKFIWPHLSGPADTRLPHRAASR